MRGGGGGGGAFLQCQKNSCPIGQTGMKYCMPQMCSLSCLVLKYAATSPNSSCQAPQDDKKLKICSCYRLSVQVR